eukprot:COSAG01_NODE_13802_length_1533_cov_1.862622_2_plen_70_part_00
MQTNTLAHARAPPHAIVWPPAERCAVITPTVHREDAVGDDEDEWLLAVGLGLLLQLRRLDQLGLEVGHV